MKKREDDLEGTGSSVLTSWNPQKDTTDAERSVVAGKGHGGTEKHAEGSVSTDLPCDCLRLSTQVYSRAVGCGGKPTTTTVANGSVL